jgi:glycosyltransferase involved in cell wall biosynthesis
MTAMHCERDPGLDLFSCHASGRLTDHLPHGEGLLAFEWLRSLGENGARVCAYSPHPALTRDYPWLRLFSSHARIRFQSFSHHVFNRESQAVYRRLFPELRSPWVWRMYPYTEAFPSFDTLGAPLAIGPLYSSFIDLPLEGTARFGLRPHHLAVALGGRGWRRNLARARLLFTETQRLERQLRPAYPGKHIVTLPPVIEPPAGVPVLRSPGRPIRLVFVANLLPEKRVLDFCRIIHALLSLGLDVEGGVIGDGPELATAQKLVASFVPFPRIRFHGQIPNSSVWEEVAAYDFFISLRPEPLGRAIMEAMSLGLVCVCRDELGPPDYIRDGENGFLMADASWESYVARLRDVIPRSDLRARISQQAIETSQPWRRSEVARLLFRSFETAR